MEASNAGLCERAKKGRIFEFPSFAPVAIVCRTENNEAVNEPDFINRSLGLIFLVIMGGSLWADIRAIIINENSPPYDLSPSNYDNSPSNCDNSSSNYDNSVSSYDNSPSNYDNSSGNYDNGINGDRRVIFEDNTFLGYYVFGSDGIINFYISGSERVGYIPSGGTPRVFSAIMGGVALWEISRDDQSLD